MRKREEAEGDFEWQPLSAIGIDTFDNGGSTIVPLEAVAPVATTSLSTQPAGSHASQAPASAPIDGEPARRRARRRTLLFAVFIVAGVLLAVLSYGGPGRPLAHADREATPSADPAPASVAQPDVLVSTPLPAMLVAAPAAAVRVAVSSLLPSPQPAATPAATRPALPPPFAASNGMLNVNARPWANVWVDGAAIGETPIGKHQVTAGRHRVTFRHPKFGEREVIVLVTAGEESYATVDFGEPSGR